MTAYYNEFDPFAAEWLRQLIAAGHIAPGVVDTRSIVDVRPDELTGYTQCHFFAGIGVWSYALRQAGWPDDRQVWTGSCPCQPFSAAGKGGGFDDERHLWPHFHWLISQCRPQVVLGEQVASKDGLAWIDLVQTDLEGTGYACGAVDTCAAGFGAPHIRQRLYWVADASVRGRQQFEDAEPAGVCGEAFGAGEQVQQPCTDSASVRCLADADNKGVEGWIGAWDRSPSHGMGDTFSAGRQSIENVSRSDGERVVSTGCEPEQFGEAGAQFSGLADADNKGLEGWIGAEECPDQRTSGARGLEGRVADTFTSERPHGEPKKRDGDEPSGRHEGPATLAGLCSDLRPGPTNGRWRDADWLFCRDGKWRPVEPGAQQMVDGSTQSLGRLCDRSIADVEAAVEAWAQRHQRDGAEGVRDLWDLLSSEEVDQRTDGGFDSVREAPFLLAFLRQLSNQGWRFQIGNERASSEASRIPVRVLRYVEQPCYSSRGRGLDEQQPGEPADPLRLLSQILAHHAEVCWGESGWQDVGSFPLAHGALARVGRLRGYGNAIVASQAQAFIEAVRETLDDRVSESLDDLLS